MAPFTNLFHPAHPPSLSQSHSQSPQPQSQFQFTPQPHHRPLRFLGQLIDDPYHGIQSHRQRTRHREVLAPDFDVRETEGAYFLEGEFPGIRDKEAIKLEWVDRRTLAIDARVGRTDLRAEWGVEERWAPLPLHEDGCTDIRDAEMEGVGEVDGGPCVREAELERRKTEEMARLREREQAQVAKQWPVREWLAERRIGHYQRTFTFPADVDAVGVRARLGQGLLRILVPKVREAGGRAKPVDIENVE